MLRNVICANIKKARLESGLQQQKVAELCGAAQAQVSRWERDVAPELRNIELLAEVFGKPAYWFFLPNEGAETPDTVTISKTWASKLAALYRGMAAVNPQLEPLPNSLTVCENTNSQDAANPRRHWPRDAAAAASLADQDLKIDFEAQNPEETANIENLIGLASLARKASH